MIKKTITILILVVLVTMFVKNPEVGRKKLVGDERVCYINWQFATMDEVKERTEKALSIFRSAFKKGKNAYSRINSKIDKREI